MTTEQFLCAALVVVLFVGALCRVSYLVGYFKGSSEAYVEARAIMKAGIPDRWVLCSVDDAEKIRERR